MSKASGRSVKSVVLDYLDARRPQIVDRAELAVIRRTVDETLGRAKPVSARYVLDILSEAGAPIERSLGGLPLDLRGRVHSHDPATAAASLIAMAAEYEAAREAGDKERAQDCRLAVRQAKDRLRLALRRKGLAAAKREKKQEILDWFLVWLEAPPLFPVWLDARRRHGPEPTGSKQAG